MKRPLAFFVLGLGLSTGVATGCAAPGTVDGVVRGDGFSLRCDHPLTKPIASGRDRFVVLDEPTSETLRTVDITLPNAAALPLDKPIAVGVDEGTQPYVDVMEGPIEVDTRSDGVQIISSVNPTTTSSVRGSITLRELDDAGVAGTFRVDLDGGGYVEGDFVAYPTTD